MLLYEKNGKNIDVYSFISNEEELIEYRRKIIEKQNKDKLFYSFSTSSEKIKSRFINDEELDTRFLEHKSEEWWSEIIQDKSTSMSEELLKKDILEKYINGDFSKVLPTRTFIPDEGVDCYLENYLVTEKAIKRYSNVEKRYIYTIEHILNLPKNLCALQLLLNGKFSRILGTWLDYSEPIQFFQAIKETEVDIDQLKKIINCQLVSETYQELENKIETTTKILQKVKKIG